MAEESTTAARAVTETWHELVDFIIREYRPGSVLDRPWSWTDEFVDLLGRDGPSIAALVRSVKEDGVKEPLLLGDDGRLWDGHHRLLAARIVGLRWVPVERGTETKRG